MKKMKKIYRSRFNNYIKKYIKYLASGHTLTLVLIKPITAINSNFHLNCCEIVSSSTDRNGFILNNYIIEVLGVDISDTNCRGNLCDHQQENIDRCCFQMIN